ncbi:MAG: hypothetical protein QM687_09350 [Ferruginibacter sp.]
MSAADELIERIRLRLLPFPQAAEVTATLAPGLDAGRRLHRAAARRGGADRAGAARRGAVACSTPNARRSCARIRGRSRFRAARSIPTDAGPGDAALREATRKWRSIRADARILGYLPAYFTGSNYLITPVVAEVAPPARFVPNPGEVKTVFEVPLPLLMREQSFGTFHSEHGARTSTRPGRSRMRGLSSGG